MIDNKSLELYLKNLNEEIISIEQEKFKIINQIKKNTEDTIISNLKLLLKVDNNYQSTLAQDEFWANYVKPVNKLIARAGVYNESYQISFKLTLIDAYYNKDQVKKLLPILYPIIENLNPVRIHKDIPNKYKVIPIFDFHKGTKGSYSLIINGKGDGAVYCENRTKPNFVSKFMSLERILNLIAKKYYHYT